MSDYGDVLNLFTRVRTFINANPKVSIDYAAIEFTLTEPTVTKFMAVTEALPDDNEIHVIDFVFQQKLNELNAEEINLLGPILARGWSLKRTARQFGMSPGIFLDSAAGIKFLLDEVRPNIGGTKRTPDSKKHTLATRLEWLRRLETKETTRKQLALEVGMSRSTMDKVVQDSLWLRQKHDFYIQHGVVTMDTWLASQRTDQAA